MLKTLSKDAVLFAIGGSTYGLMEVLWRQRTHISMVITGGVCFLTLYKLYRRYPRMSLISRCAIGSLIITSAELLTGLIVNLWLRLDVWDYSSMPLNFLGQICLPFSLLWGLLCIPIYSICRYFYKVFDLAQTKTA